MYVPAKNSASSELYPWQVEALDRAIRGNVIVMIPTGGGKTLIAVKVIDHYRALVPAKKAIFVVPTRPLVRQQAEYCEIHCATGLRAAQISGMLDWDINEWQTCIRTHDILVGTAQIFKDALLSRKLLVSQCSLFVFDECHNAVGNSAMVGIMHDAVLRLPEEQRPRIIGLTGSIINSSLKGAATKRKKLEDVLTAPVFCPDMRTFVRQQNKEFSSISYAQPDASVSRLAGERTRDLLACFGGGCFRDTAEIEKVVAATQHVAESLGIAGFHYFLREGVARQLEQLARTLAELPGGRGRRTAEAVRSALPRLRAALRASADDLTSTSMLAEPPYVSPKLLRLLDLLNSKCGELQRSNCEVVSGLEGVAIDVAGAQLRALVFVERIAVAHPLADVLNRYYAMPPPTCVEDVLAAVVRRRCAMQLRAEPVAGVGAMAESEREAAIRLFRAGEVQVLVATASLEEGIDVPMCNLVVRFDGISTARAHIQGAGRARQAEAQVIYFENSAVEEERKREALEVVAKDPTLGFNKCELVARSSCTSNRGGDGDDGAGVMHPFIHPSPPNAELNALNAITVVFEYIQATMGQGFEPLQHVFSDVDEVVCTFPKSVVRRLVSITYPTPDGPVVLDLTEVDRLWRGQVVRDVVHPERLRNYSTRKLEETRFLYAAALDMAARGFLGPDNKPSVRALTETRHVCHSFILSPGVRMKNSYAGADVFRLSSVPMPSQATTGNYAVELASPAALLASPGFNGSRAQVSLGSSMGREKHFALSSGLSGPSNCNYKGALNEYCQQAQRPLPTYETLPFPKRGQIFCSSVTLGSEGDGAFSFSGEGTSKKAAEQSAARIALAFLHKQRGN